MSVLTIPPQRAADVDRAKDFLFKMYGENDWTEQSYLEIANRSNQPVEFSEGRLIVLPMPTPDHQDLVWKICEAFKTWARKHGGRAFISPLPIRLGLRKFREPDVMLYSAEHSDRIAKQHGGPPDLVVEVLSPSTQDVDMEEKMYEYAQAGIGEYWIVDSESIHVEQYALDGDRYKLHAALGKGDVVRSVTLDGLEVRVDEVYEK